MEYNGRRFSRLVAESINYCIAKQNLTPKFYVKTYQENVTHNTPSAPCFVIRLTNLLQWPVLIDTRHKQQPLPFFNHFLKWRPPDAISCGSRGEQGCNWESVCLQELPEQDPLVPKYFFHEVSTNSTWRKHFSHGRFTSWTSAGVCGIGQPFKTRRKLEPKLISATKKNLPISITQVV